MKYTKQELIWLLNLVDKSIIEATEDMKICSNSLKALVELKRANMLDLRDKMRKDLEQQQRKGRTER